MLFDNFESLKIQMEIALETDISNKAKIEELNLILKDSNKGIKEKTIYQHCFIETKDVYKFGFWLTTRKGNLI